MDDSIKRFPQFAESTASRAWMFHRVPRLPTATGAFLRDVFSVEVRNSKRYSRGRQLVIRNISNDTILFRADGPFGDEAVPAEAKICGPQEEVSFDLPRNPEATIYWRVSKS